ncbi:MAG: DUF2141 domain-containing protein, partial [Sphingopyxis sp.]
RANGTASRVNAAANRTPTAQSGTAQSGTAQSGTAQSGTAPASTAPASTAPTTMLAITLTDQRNKRGHMLICVTTNAAAFPDCRADATATRLRVAATQNWPLRIPIAVGRPTAIAVVHDENGDGRLNTLLAMPREGFGFSRNPALRMGPPSFESAAFPVPAAAAGGGGSTGTAASPPINQIIRLRYML